MKKQLLVILLCVTTALFAQCPPGSVTLSSQADVDQFGIDYPSCTTISGDLNLNLDFGASPTDIADLTPLSAITSVTGTIDLGFAPALTSLDGLDNLASVGGTFYIYYMDSLSDFSAMSQLTSVGGALVFYYNSSQTNFIGFENLVTIGDYLQVEYNYVLQDFTGLSGLQSIGDRLAVTNSAMTSFDGLDSLTSIGDQIFVELMPDLASITGLSSVTSLGTSIAFNDCPSLTSLSGLDNITGPITILQLVNCTSLSVCNVESVCAHIGASGTINISGNASGCNSGSEIAAACATCPTTAWNGSVWSNGAPDATKTAVVNADLDVVADFEACALTISNNSTVTVDPGFDITVHGVISTGTNAVLKLGNNASLFQDDNVASPGKIRVDRNAEMRRKDYIFWSSPVAGQNVRAFSPDTRVNRFYVLNEDTNGFDGLFAYNLGGDEVPALQDPASYAFAAAKGYMVRAPNNHPTSVTPWTGTFTGTPHNGTYTIEATNGAGVSALGFNLIGNPYPSPINTDDFLSANPSVGTVYFWTHTNQNEGGDNYAYYNGTGNAAGDGGDTPNDYIQCGQGFLINVPSTVTITFDNSMRAVNHDDQFFRSAPSAKNRMWFNFKKDGEVKSQALIGYVADATNAYEAAFDGQLIPQDATLLYSIVDSHALAIQGRALPFENTDNVKLGYKTLSAGNFSIELADLDGLFDGDQDIYLKDNLTSAVHDIKAEAYTFASEAGTFESRFEIIYNTTLGTELPVMDSDAVVYKNGTLLEVRSGSAKMQSVTVFDVRGRRIAGSESVNASAASFPLDATQQLLLVQITSEDGSLVTKKVIF